jgi:hypothetical protein
MIDAKLRNAAEAERFLEADHKILTPLPLPEENNPHLEQIDSNSYTRMSLDL